MILQHRARAQRERSKQLADHRTIAWKEVCPRWALVACVCWGGRPTNVDLDEEDGRCM